MNTNQWDVLLVKSGVGIVQAQQWAAAFSAVISDSVMGKEETFAFLGQVLWESSYLTRLEEDLENYTPQRLLEVFKGRITPAQAAQYGKTPTQKANPQGIANIVYGGAWGKKYLGNTEPWDGWAFRGSGPFQITGRDNVTAAAKWTELPYLEHPELLRKPGYEAVEACVWYWKTRVGDRWKDATALRKAVNGGTLGLKETIALTSTVSSAWEAIA